MLSFANVYISPSVRASLHKVVQTHEHKRFWELVSKLKTAQFEIPGLNIEKLYSKSGKLFSARMSKEMRLIFSIKQESQGQALIIHELNHHDQAYERAKRSTLSDKNLAPAGELLESVPIHKTQELDQALLQAVEPESANWQGLLFKVPQFLLNDPDKYIQFEKSLDRYLILSQEQKELLALKDKAFLVQGPAGTGKTTLALFAALNIYEENSNDAVYLFTYHEELSCVCRAYKVNLLGQEESQTDSEAGIKVFSYIEFCRRQLKQSLRKSEAGKRCISKEQSIDILKQILAQKSRWSRNFVAEDLYGLIYSILKGRFMPGSENLPASKEDYERIFKDYGGMPLGFADSLEVFSNYQSRLERNRLLDEADVIRLSYESLKQNALLTGIDQRLWIVIDEVQDFTELEWKSILLFWENHCKHHKGSPSYPFLCGDRNQNISRSGFRWQELESYLQSILKKMHRPNSIKKVTLHQNYRNSLQIHQLAAFVRKLGSETSDLGVAPTLQAQRPYLIVSTDDELVSFLLEKDSSEELTNPLVVLVEDDESLDYLRRKLSDCHSIFLLSLRSSKGLEFEDVIIHRAFSQASKLGNQSESSRSFDLWYMGITRARKNLLLVQSAQDREAIQNLLAEREDEFFELLQSCDREVGLSLFWKNCQPQAPNYNVIFLERKLAQDLWQEFLNEENMLSDNRTLSDYAANSRDRAISLWRRCLDYSSLGRALMHLQVHAEAAFYLNRAGLKAEAAFCLESSGQFEKAALEYESLGMLQEAARCFQESGNNLKAGKLYEECQNWLLAAENYHAGGDLDKAARSCEKSGMLRSAADIYKLKGNYKKSAELYKKVEDYLLAAEMHLLHNDNLDAARCFQKAGQFAKSIELYEALDHWSEAGEAAKQAGLNSKAGNYFLKAGRLADAAHSFEAAQLFEDAGNLHMRIKDYRQSGICYELAGKIDKAASMFEEAGDWQKTLELAQVNGNQLLLALSLEKLNEFKKAAEVYVQCGANSEAAYCYEKVSEFTVAADLYLKSQNLTQAANCLAKTDRHFDAAKLYVVSGQFSQAYEQTISTSSSGKMRARQDEEFKRLLAWCIEERRTAAAAALLEIKKDYAEAAEKYKECLMLSKAAECLEKYGKQAEAAQVYREAGEIEKAANCFKQARIWQEAALCFERIQKWAEAKKMYERCRNKEGIIRCENALNWL